MLSYGAAPVNGGMNFQLGESHSGACQGDPPPARGRLSGPELELQLLMIPCRSIIPGRVAILFAIAVATVLPLHASAAQGAATPKPPVEQKKRPSTALTEANIETAPTRFPLRIPNSGPITLQLQILLDRAGFSPGIIDGAWGLNAAKAVTFFAKPSDSARFTGDSPPAVTSIDRVTYERLRSAAQSRPMVRWYTVVSEDLTGPFTRIPENVYSQAKLSCLCYASSAEALAERFHTSAKFLAQLNPRVKIDALEAGTRMLVPNINLEGSAVPQDTSIAARLIISRKGYWTHVLDAGGNIIYHFPSTLGAGYDPSPSGAFKVTDVSYDPAFRYQPKLFAEVPDDEPQALLPSGPNSPVGVVWISLSKRHYGIHGTSSPETIGYANSHGCVRLTNWDAVRLSDLVEDGTPVEFK
jgi:lipoprotein-anchoring transpeptidase ErfK/SrfK